MVTLLGGFIVVGVATGISVIGRSVIEEQLPTEAAASDGELPMKQVVKKLNTLERMVDRYFLFDKNTEQMEAGIYKGMLAGLEDPYTTYYTAEEYESMTEETEGVYCGIGVLVSQNYTTKTVTVLRVFPGSPAEEAGMMKGDIIYEVDGLATAEQELDVLVQQHIRGEEGTFVDLTVLREGEKIPMHVERRLVESVMVEYQMTEDKTGYIMVTQFDMVTGDQFKKAVDALEEQGMERLVIDLRDNPGGVVDACVQMAAYVLPEEPHDGTILSTATKDGQAERYYCAGGKIQHQAEVGFSNDPRYPQKDGHELDIPIAVLINGQSASASEVFAGALQDYEKAILVGTTSFGKGIVQSLIPLDDGSAIKITVAHYYTPSGHDLHKTGLTPDVEVELELDEDLIGQYDVPLERDNQVQAAIQALKEKQE